MESIFDEKVTDMDIFRFLPSSLYSLDPGPIKVTDPDIFRFLPPSICFTSNLRGTNLVDPKNP